MRRFIPTAIARDYRHALEWRTRSFLGRGEKPPSAWGTGARRPVVLIPGVWERWQFLQPVGDVLNAAGHPVHALPVLGRNAHPIPTLAEVVAGELERLDLTDVAIVAHSKGGLIAKQVMGVHDPDHRVDRLIAIATPFSGTASANWMLQPALREFRPMHPTIRALADNLEVNERVTSIYGAFDLHIPTGSALDGAHNIRVPYIGHFGVLTDPRVLSEVLTAVQR